MTDEYDDLTAHHYRAYRPLLHSQILRKCLSKDEKYAKGLDIGSGTGHSSLALTHFCQKVFGIEPSLAMRQKALPHPNVVYQDYTNGRLDFIDDMFDIITLAGSLYYAKSQGLLYELVRVGQNKATILVYDFEILLDEVLAKVKIKIPQDLYNHHEDFSGLVNHGLVEFDAGTHTMEVHLGVSDLAHLLLSVKSIYWSVVDAHESPDLHGKLMELLYPIANQGSFALKAKTYHRMYRIVK